MLSNYFKIAWRNLLKNPGYSLITIFCLAAGLASFIIILLFVQHEWSYDRYHKNSDHIFRVIQKRPSTGGPDYWTVTSPALTGAMQHELPEVSAATSVLPTANPLLGYGQQHYKESGILTDTSFLHIFTFPLLTGNPQTALNDPNNIVLTQSLARKIFGDKDPMGQTLIYQNQYPHIVTGVMADVPENSHFTFSYILPAISDPYYKACVTRKPWFNNGLYTFVVLRNEASAAQAEARMRAYINRNLQDWKPDERMAFLFQPLTDIHLRSQHLDTFEFEKSGNSRYVYLFLAIGFVILLLACANYTNLAIARSMRRAQEVGIRKVSGAWRGQLMLQFLGESLIMTFLSMILALGCVHLLLPLFSRLMDRPLHLHYLGNQLLLPGLLLLLLVVSLLSGGYPAFVITALRPIQVLKGKQVSQSSRFNIQRILVVGQYAVSIALMAGSFIIYQQMQYVQKRQLGYNRDHVLAIKVSDTTLSNHYNAIRQDLLHDPRILSMSYALHLPTSIKNNQSMFDWENSGGKMIPTHTTSIDYDFLRVYDISMVAGRGFSRDFGTDTLGAPIALLNEASVKALGWTPQEAIGKKFDYSDGRGKRTIIGVMKDFHFNSIHHELEPLVLTLAQSPTGYITARIRPEDVHGTIALFERTVGRFTTYPFEYEFLDDNFNQLYKQDLRLGGLFGYFTLLAIVIASLGLFGLAAYATEQRTKEIGVRKVMGATVTNIVSMLGKDYAKLVLFSFLIAVPLAWYVMSRWLEDFAYRIHITWWVFALPGLLTIVIALLTVSYQSIKVALMNPLKSLRSE